MVLELSVNTLEKIQKYNLALFMMRACDFIEYRWFWVYANL